VAGSVGDFGQVFPVEVADVEARFDDRVGEVLRLVAQMLEALVMAGQPLGELLAVGGGLSSRAQLLDLSQGILCTARRFLGRRALLMGPMLGLDSHGAVPAAGGLRGG
jgi:hypothetical protein